MRIRIKENNKIEELSENDRKKYADIVIQDRLDGDAYLCIIGLKRGECEVEETFKKEIDQIKDLWETSKSSMEADKRSREDVNISIEGLEKLLADAKAKVTGLEENIALHEDNMIKAVQMSVKKTGIPVQAWL